MLPGLHDHHVHLRSAASALDSFFVGPPGVSTRAEFTRLLANATPGPYGWIRAVGYHDSVTGVLDRTALDAIVRDVPVRIQHRSGALWVLNSEALGRIGLAEHPDGRLRSADRGWSHALAHRETDLAELSRRITATGVTDATPTWTTTTGPRWPPPTHAANSGPGPASSRRVRRSCMTTASTSTPSRNGLPDSTTRGSRSPCTASPPPSWWWPSPPCGRPAPTRGTASNMPPWCPTTTWPIWPNSG